jgi:cytidylate kinase
MTASNRFVVISGIPGCGKSTIGLALANRLDSPHLNKDDFLDSILDGIECPNEETRHRLSRAADQAFERAARSCAMAVLDSFWRHPAADITSGTPSKWLVAPEIHAVEVFCNCPPELAATRFLGRLRHKGHLDPAWSHESLVAQSRELLRALPLGVGTLIEVDTTDSVDADLLARRVRIALEV